MEIEPDPAHTGYQDKRTGLCFEPVVGEYTREGMREFATRNEGYLVRYRGPGSAMELIDIYIFGQEAPHIPEGTEADEILGTLAQTMQGLEQVVRDGKYCDYEVLVTERVAYELPPLTPVEFLHAAVEYRHGPAGSQPDVGRMRAHFLLRGFRGRLLKIRFTYRVEDAERAEPRWWKFLAALLEQFQLPN